jgi:hypothetical protein
VEKSKTQFVNGKKKEIDHFLVIQFHGEMIRHCFCLLFKNSSFKSTTNFSIPLAISGGDCRAVRLRTLPLDGSAKFTVRF